MNFKLAMCVDTFPLKIFFLLEISPINPEYGVAQLVKF